MSSLTLLVELSFPATGRGCRQRLQGEHWEPSAQCGPHLDGLQVYSSNRSPGGPAGRLLSVASGWSLRPTFLPGSQATAGLLLLRLHIHLASHSAFCIHSVQFSSVAQSCPTLCDPMDYSTPGLPVHHQLPEFTQTHVH